jgi:two-component system NtrC family response regulator
MFDTGEGHREVEGLLRESVEELERKLIIEAMEKTGDHQTKAAELLGISERMLRYKLKKYGLKE